jgi:2-haloacid dehalogenase
MPALSPKFITFDCYGTLTNFHMSSMARTMFADRVPADRMDAFVRDFGAHRLDEVLGAWKPYADVIATDAEARAYYDAVPTWGPHPDVPEALARVAKKFPLVILSNASDDQIMRNVALLGAPFHAVFTAQQAQAYKPRMQAFEYMLGKLGCQPADLLHVSSSMRYDLMTAHDLGIRDKVFVNRGHDPGNPYYGYTEVRGIDGLAALLGV